LPDPNDYPYSWWHSTDPIHPGIPDQPPYIHDNGYKYIRLSKNTDLIVHKYLMPNLSAAGGYGTGAELDPGEIDDTATPLEGITFTIYKITMTGHDGDVLNPADFLLDDSADPTELKSPADGTVTYALITPGTAQITDVDGEATFSGLAAGSYVVVEQESGKSSCPVAPFIVTLPMPDPVADGWLTTVHAYPKNQLAFEKKVVSDPGVSIGDTVTYKITVGKPAGYEAITSSDALFDLTDTLDEALTFAGVGAVTIKTYANGSDTVVETVAASGRVSVSGQLITIDLLDIANPETWDYIVVTFDTTVNANILTKAIHNVDNTATLSFDNDEGTAWQTDSNTNSETHTGQIRITAQDKDSASKKLLGARFKISLLDTGVITSKRCFNQHQKNIAVTAFAAQADGRLHSLYTAKSRERKCL
jgi:fimbrial isopeptide formation D2 family protein